MAKSNSAPQRESNSDQTSDTGNKPAETLRYRNLKAAIWKNTGQSGHFFSVTFSRSYQDQDQQWHEANSFNTSDLPMLAKLANDCHSWITREERKEQPGSTSGGKR